MEVNKENIDRKPKQVTNAKPTQHTTKTAKSETDATKTYLEIQNL
jgi:hypothetical protein